MINKDGLEHGVVEREDTPGTTAAINKYVLTYGVVEIRMEMVDGRTITLIYQRESMPISIIVEPCSSTDIVNRTRAGVVTGGEEV